MAFFSGLYHRFRDVFDPNRLAMAQAFLAGDYGSAADQFRQLQAEHERLRRWDRKKQRAAILDDGENGALERNPLGRRDGSAALASDAVAGSIGSLGSATTDSMANDHVDSAPSALFDDSAVGPALRDIVGTADEKAREKRLPPGTHIGPFGGIRRRAIDEKALARAKGVNGYGYNPQEGDELLLARALFAEGSNVPRDMAALASTIVNRIRIGRRPSSRNELGATLFEVLNAPHQFSFMPNRGGNGPGGSDRWARSAHPEALEGSDRKAWQTARKLAAWALGADHDDPTDGATFFFHSPDYVPGNAQSAPDQFFRDGIENGSLRAAPYRTPYPPRPHDRRAPWPSYFFHHRGDFPPK